MFAPSMRLEVLYFAGCPGHERLLPVLRALAGEHGIALSQRRVDSTAEAAQVRFLGSPSVRVNGVDVEPGADQRNDFGLKCRLYRSSEGQSGLPPQRWIADALDAIVLTIDAPEGAAPVLGQRIDAFRGEPQAAS